MEAEDSPWEFFRPVTGIGSNSSSVPASACWGSKSEISRDESAEDKTRRDVEKEVVLDEKLKRQERSIVALKTYSL